MGPSTVGLLSVLLLAVSAESLPKFVVPNFPDLTIKTRRTDGERWSSVQTLYLKGARQRTEHLTEKPESLVGSSAAITQCDKKLMVNLNEKGKTYVSFPIEDWATRIKRANPAPPQEMTGAEVIVAIDSVDTGERRQVGGYTARRVKTTTKVEPGPGAVTQASVTEVDGWYIDLPGLGCQESRGTGLGWSTVGSGKSDRVRFRKLGTAQRGYAIEETSRQTQAGRTTISRVELLEFSEAPLDASLFELPAGYSPALHQPRGGYDMSKPDTLSNRLQSYWAELTTSMRQWFR
jgi:hypothetical protein